MVIKMKKTLMIILSAILIGGGMAYLIFNKIVIKDNNNDEYVATAFQIGAFSNYDNAIRIEFWGDTIDSIKYFNIDTQLSMNEIDEVNIYPFTEFILDKYDENIIKKQKYLPNYSENVGNISSYLSGGVICYYDYNTLLTSYSLLIDSIEAYDKENKHET